MATRRLQFGEVGEQGDVPVRKEQEVIVEEATRCNLGMQQDVAENQGIQGGVSTCRPILRSFAADLHSHTN